jgi:DNA-binding MarR family transcriptional regulator
METQDLRTLKILEEIDNEHTPSQRELAQKLDISLGLVNSFIKRLVNKGYFKITHIPKNRVRYLLTPKGAAEKTRLTYAYIHYSFELYRRSRQKLHELFNDFVTQGVRRIIFYGMSDLAEIAYLSLQETSIKLVAVVDNYKIGDKFLGGIVVQDPSELKLLSFDRILVTTIELEEEVLAEILASGISRDAVFMLQ